MGLNIDDVKSASTRRSVNKQIMSARGETRSSHHRGEVFKLVEVPISGHKVSAEDGTLGCQGQSTLEEAACKPPHATHHCEMRSKHQAAGEWRTSAMAR
jgi:hypothetical protein